MENHTCDAKTRTEEGHPDVGIEIVWSCSQCGREMVRTDKK